MNKQTVIGIFDYGVDAQRAVQQLESNGFSKDRIDLTVNGANDQNDTMNQRHDSNTSGRVGNFFNSLMDDREDSSRYTNVAQNGSVVTVHATSAEEATRAAKLLDSCGAIDVNERSKGFTSGMRSGSDSSSWTNANIPVVEENLNVGKREVETGGARIRSRIIERPVEETMRLREEHINIERNPVNRPANERDLRNFRDGETEITEHAEVPVVEKEARVVEEIKLSKETSERTETIKDTVRKQDVDVDRLNNDTDRDRLNDRDRDRV